jgi:hypothetical protein
VVAVLGSVNVAAAVAAVEVVAVEVENPKRRKTAKAETVAATVVVLEAELSVLPVLSVVICLRCQEWLKWRKV